MELWYLRPGHKIRTRDGVEDEVRDRGRGVDQGQIPRRRVRPPVRWDRGPRDRDAVETLFGVVHTIKSADFTDQDDEE